MNVLDDYKKLIWSTAFFCVILVAEPAFSFPLTKLKLPTGFSISLFADDLTGARSMTLAPDGTIFVGTRNRGGGKVYAVRDGNKDGVADSVVTLDSGLRMPNGVAYFENDLYFAEVSKFWRMPNILQQIENKKFRKELVRGDFPTELHHGWKFIAFGPDNKLYIPVGAPCNICLSEDERFASIMRMDKDGKNLEVYAAGVRNSVGFDWNPKDNSMWFTDNGRDMLGDDLPPDELNRITEKGQHFGYPFCHAGEIADPEFGAQAPCSKFKKPEQKLGPHVAALGMRFYRGKNFPDKYHNQIFIAEHGSWNRSKKIGYRVSTVMLAADGKVLSYEPFLTGFLESENSVLGRPVDILNMPDGSLLVSDDHAGRIYRIRYNP